MRGAKRARGFRTSEPDAREAWLGVASRAKAGSDGKLPQRGFRATQIMAPRSLREVWSPRTPGRRVQRGAQSRRGSSRWSARGHGARQQPEDISIGDGHASFAAKHDRGGRYGPIPGRRAF